MRSVTVYPSDYGLRRMKYEERFGPQMYNTEHDDAASNSEDGDVGSEGSEEFGELDGGDGGTRKKVGLVIAGGECVGGVLSWGAVSSFLAERDHAHCTRHTHTRQETVQ